MTKTILIIAVILLIGGGALLLSMEVTDENNELPPEEEINKDNNQNTETEEGVDSSFIECLADVGVVIYGSSTCPACSQLEQEYGGYEVVKPIYLDCSGLGTAEEIQRCRNEMKTNFVPEIQINGELFDGWGSPENLAKETGCELKIY